MPLAEVLEVTATGQTHRGATRISRRATRPPEPVHRRQRNKMGPSIALAALFIVVVAAAVLLGSGSQPTSGVAAEPIIVVCEAPCDFDLELSMLASQLADSQVGVVVAESMTCDERLTTTAVVAGLQPGEIVEWATDVVEVEVSGQPAADDGTKRLRWVCGPPDAGPVQVTVSLPESNRQAQFSFVGLAVSED